MLLSVRNKKAPSGSGAKGNATCNNALMEYVSRILETILFCQSGEHIVNYTFFLKGILKREHHSVNRINKKGPPGGRPKI